MKKLIIGLVITVFCFMAVSAVADNTTSTARTYGNTIYLTNGAGNHTGTVTTNGSVTTVVTNNPQTGTVNQGN